MGYLSLQLNQYKPITALTDIEGTLTGVGHIKYGITCIGQQVLVAIQHVGYQTS